MLGTSGRTGTCRDNRDTETDGWTEQRGLKTRGAADRERLVREEAQGLVGRGRIKVAGSGESTVSGEKTNKGKSHATYSQTILSKIIKATLVFAPIFHELK